MKTTEDERIRILAVDDEKSLLKLYQNVIEKKMSSEGCYDIVLCTDGDHAVESVQDSIGKNQPFSLVFMDVNLGSSHDGIWTAKEIRKLDPEIQVVFVTGVSDLDIKEISKQIPPPDKLYFLQKPFQTTEIIQFVISLGARWLKDRKYEEIKVDLESKIQQRTAKIKKTNQILKDEIKKRRKIEKDLQKQEEQYRNIIEKNADAMVVLDDQGIVQYMNSASIRLFDRKPEQFIGQSFGFSTVFDEDTEINILRKAGSFIVGEMRSVETEWNGKKASITSIRDITRRKEMETQIKENLANLEKLMLGTVQAMAITTEKRDPYTSGHMAQVEKIAVRIAEKMQQPREFIKGLSMAAMIHDIGKIAVPAEILSKPKRLTDIEFSLIKAHSQVGHDIVQNIEFPWPIAKIILQHHERIDGTGYPQGIKGAKILLEARIISVADSLEAIVSHRPYRASLGEDFAINEIASKKGILYDPDVVDACLSLYEAGCLFERD